MAARKKKTREPAAASDIYQSSHSSGNRKIDRATIAVMTQRSDSHVTRFRETEELTQRIALTRQECEFRQATRQALLMHLGIDVSAATHLKAARSERLQDLISSGEFTHRPYTSPPTQQDQHGAAGSMEMWWARTSWWGNAPGIVFSWQDDGPHFSGVVHVDSDDLQLYSITVLAQFALGDNRIPASARGPVISTPNANVFGKVYGIAKDFGFFTAFDDQWAKCWLNTRQSVWVTIPGATFPLFGDRIPWGTNTASRRLVFLDSMGVQDTYLQGRIGLPPVSFDLWPDITSVEIDLEFTFAMQLEGGDSNLVFGHDPDWPSNVIQTLQWMLLPN